VEPPGHSCARCATTPGCSPSISTRGSPRLWRPSPIRGSVHLGSAVDLRTILARHGLSQVDVVLSGIPFSTMPAFIARRILEAVTLSLAPGGRFVAYQILGTVGVVGREVIGPPEVTLVLRNIPPVRIYTWRKQAAP
jgi:phospholipid N-methyltransferase